MAMSRAAPATTPADVGLQHQLHRHLTIAGEGLARRHRRQLLLHPRQRTSQAMGDFGNMALIKAVAQQARQVTWPMVGWIPIQSIFWRNQVGCLTTLEIRILWQP